MISAFPRPKTLTEQSFASGGRQASLGSTCARAGGRCSPHHRGFSSCSPRLKTDWYFVRERQNHTRRF